MFGNTGLASLLAVGGLLGGVVIGAAACGGDDDDGGSDTAATSTPGVTGSETPAAEAAAVTVSDDTFSPGSLTVAAGTAVTWNWSGSNPHSVVMEALGVQSETLTGSGTFTHTFDAPGSYAYQCGIHGASMAGTIVVE
jgi:plastocyanin